MILHVAYPHRWGPGRVHIAAGPYSDTLCAQHLHGRRESGELAAVTCKKCLKIYRHNMRPDTLN